MKIAELFVALGFQTQGAQQLPVVERGLAKAEGSAVKLLAGVTALNVGFALMMKTAVAASVGLQKFFFATDLSTQEMQRWVAAAKLGNVEGAELIATVSALQKAQADIKLGQGNIAPWQFFGLSINQTPFDVMRKLHEKFLKMDPAIARTMAAQMGISENLFQWLRRTDLALESVNNRLLLTEKQQAALNNLNVAWQRLSVSVVALRNHLAVTFAGTVTVAANAFRMIVDWLGKFVDWLNSGTTASTAVKWVLLAVASAVALLTVALTALVAVLGTLGALLKLAALAAMPVVAALAPIVIVVGLMIAGVAALVLLWNDFLTAVEGGKTAFKWMDASVKSFKALANAIGWVIDNAQTLKTTAGWLFNPAGMALDLQLKAFRASPAMQGRPGAITQENNVNVHVHGADDPKSTGREVASSVKQAVSEASYQMPLLQY